ncbi:MAG: DNA polymerase I [Clostridia bacterium]|nr:DNA polymerase I [Clostridia bacterium]
MEKERIIIIDGNSLVNRAYYAIQRPMITADGLYTQGVYGFLSMLNKIRNDYKPTHMLVAWDRKAPTFRHEEFADYKAGRQKMPPELAMQLPILKDVLHAMNIAMYEIDGYEADDILGTVAKRAEEIELKPYIITGDKDALQLATDKTSVIITKKGISEFAMYDEDAIQLEYGFSHEQFIDYKGLRGDPSDNIPGIPGVGEKTAIKLIQEFGSIENLIENLDKIDSLKLREKIKENTQIALMSKRLATIFTDLPLNFSIEDCRIKRPDTVKLIELYNRLEFRTHLKNLMQEEKALNLNDIEVSAKESTVSFSGNYTEVEFIHDVKNAAAFLHRLDTAKTIVIDMRSDDHHVNTPSLEGVELLVDGQAVYITEIEDYKSLFKATISGKKIGFTGFNLQRIYYIFKAFDVDINHFYTVFDCALAQYVLSPNRKVESIQTLIYEILHVTLDEEEGYESQIDLFSKSQRESLKTIGKKLTLILKLQEALTDKLKEEDLMKVLTVIEFPLSKILADMEVRGFKLNKDVLVEFGNKLKASITKIEKEIHELAGEAFNVNSPQQLGIVLFDHLGLPGAKKTKRGYVTNVEVLEKLAADFPVVAKVLEYRTLVKLNSTYVEGMLPLIDKNGKIHAHYQQTVAATGRISCTEPNLQNIPIKQDLGRQLRKAFTTDSDEYILVGADYSQIELRVLAHMSGDQTLIDGFNKGLDVHRITASKVFEVPEDQVTDLMRSNAKAVNFGVIYGMSGYGLSNELTISRQKAELYINEYFAKYSAVKKFMDDTIKNCKREGYVTTLFGRKRPIPEINASAYMVRQQGERLAMNTPIQGTAADIIKIAMIHVFEALSKECPKSALILQIHDELIVQAHYSEREKVKKLLEECMKNAAKLKVQLDVSLNEGINWYYLK